MKNSNSKLIIIHGFSAEVFQELEGAAIENWKEKVRGARRGCDEREEEKGMLSCAKEQEENEGRK